MNNLNQNATDILKSNKGAYIPYFLNIDENWNVYLNDVLYIDFLEQVGFAKAKYEDEICFVHIDRNIAGKNDQSDHPITNQNDHL